MARYDFSLLLLGEGAPKGRMRGGVFELNTGDAHGLLHQNQFIQPSQFFLYILKRSCYIQLTNVVKRL
jgi:hypothetical protein